MKPLPKILLALTAVAALSLFSVQLAQAYNVTLEQVGSNVVANGSGPINLTGLTLFGRGKADAAVILPAIGDINTGPNGFSLLDAYTGFTGPDSFGDGTVTRANFGSGNHVGITGKFVELFTPRGYVSGTALSSGATWRNATFAS